MLSLLSSATCMSRIKYMPLQVVIIYNFFKKWFLLFQRCIKILKDQNKQYSKYRSKK